MNESLGEGATAAYLRTGVSGRCLRGTHRRVLNSRCISEGTGRLVTAGKVGLVWNFLEREARGKVKIVGCSVAVVIYRGWC